MTDFKKFPKSLSENIPFSNFCQRKKNHRSFLQFSLEDFSVKNEGKIFPCKEINRNDENIPNFKRGKELPASLAFGRQMAAFCERFLYFQHFF